MNKLCMYAIAFVLTLGFTACKSDDDGGVDCGEAGITLGETFAAYTANESTDNCAEYKTAIEVFLSNNCDAGDEDEEIANFYRAELESLGDCTFAGLICLSCTNSGERILVCRGENGNAFIDDRDIEITFERYVELSDCE
ncbi:hypothetical protein [Aquimarina pacifica]|uniref:hypothetical protein n=1 Tax=Aquimarina pacifica TaxID=1296415 RepID=UPI000558F0D8|nr:hypothetical protein [Aquimarina pacifica]